MNQRRIPTDMYPQQMQQKSRAHSDVTIYTRDKYSNNDVTIWTRDKYSNNDVTIYTRDKYNNSHARNDVTIWTRSKYSNYLFDVILRVRVRIVFRKTVVGDWS